MPDSPAVVTLTTLTEALATFERPGEALVRIIAPGAGSSGYYPAEVLKRDGPRVFVSGTHMFWDHPSATEAWERPERSLRDLAGVLLEDAHWVDGDAAGLYARVRVFPPYAQALGAMAEHIGVSIRADGRRGPETIDGLQVVTAITEVASVDFVTAAGAGGKIVELFESARREHNPDQEATDMDEVTRLNEALRAAERERDNQTAQVRELTEARDALARERDELAAERDRLRERVALSEARGVVSTALAESNLPEITRARIARLLENAAPTNDEGELDRDALQRHVDEVIETERTYLEQVGGSPVSGAGDSSEATGGDGAAQLAEAFKGLGLSDELAEIAAAGR